MSKTWSVDEKRKLLKSYKKCGPAWSLLAKEFGRTAMSLKKCFLRTDWKNEKFENESKKIKRVVGKLEEKTPLTEVEVQDEISSMLEARKEKIVQLHEVRKMNEGIDKLAQQELIIDKIVGSITKIPEFKVENIKRPTYPKENSPQESFLVISDCHVGLAVIPEEVGGIGNYNLGIFQQRMKKLTNTVCRITDLHRTTHQIDTLNIAMLGDIVHGSNDAGKWGFLHTEQNIMDQVFSSMSALTEAILTLKTVYPKINIYCVGGNHARIGSRRGIEKEFVNWDYLIYTFLKSSLALQKGINFSIPRSNFNVAEVMGQKFLLVHGSNIKSWNGIPWYGLNRMEARYKNMLDNGKNVDKMWEAFDKSGIDKSDTKKSAEFAFNYMKAFQYMICGHFHSGGEIETASGGRIILNSSFVGGDDYSISDLVLSNVPSQKFFGVNKNRKTFSYDIELMD